MSTKDALASFSNMLEYDPLVVANTIKSLNNISSFEQQKQHQQETFQYEEFYDPQTKKMLKSRHTMLTTSLKHGPWQCFYRSGALLAKGTFVNNKPFGVYEQYFEDGVSISWKVEFDQQGRICGDSTYFFPNGAVEKVVHYDVAGKIDRAVQFEAQTNGDDIKIFEMQQLSDQKTTRVKHFSNHDGVLLKTFEISQKM